MATNFLKCIDGSIDSERFLLALSMHTHEAVGSQATPNEMVFFLGGGGGGGGLVGVGLRTIDTTMYLYQNRNHSRDSNTNSV